MTGLVAHSNHTGDGVWNQLGLGEGCKIDDPDTVGVIVEQVGRGLKRQPCLAATTGAHEREQASSTQ
jgi:hypothetical protein